MLLEEAHQIRVGLGTADLPGWPTVQLYSLWGRLLRDAGGGVGSPNKTDSDNQWYGDDDAIPCLSRALAAIPAVAGIKRLRMMIEIREEMAGLLSAVGNFRGAVSQRRQALAACRDLHPGESDHKMVTAAMVRHGSAMTAVGDFSDAVELIEAALALQRARSTGEDDETGSVDVDVSAANAEVALSLHALGDAYIGTGEIEKARGAVEEANLLLHQIYSSGNPNRLPPVLAVHGIWSGGEDAAFSSSVLAGICERCGDTSGGWYFFCLGCAF